MPKHSEEHLRRRLCALLRDLREESELRQVDVAAALNEPQSYVSKYESGERRLDVIELVQVCDVLGISLQDFFSRLLAE